MIRQLTRGRILITNRPSDAAHLADAGKVRLPNVTATETDSRGFDKGRL